MNYLTSKNTTTKGSLGQASSADGLPTRPLAGAVGALMSSLGVLPSQTRSTAETVVCAVLAERRHSADVVELRHGKLTLEASAAETRLLRFDTDVLLGVFADRLPGGVAEIHIRTRR